MGDVLQKHGFELTQLFLPAEVECLVAAALGEVAFAVQGGQRAWFKGSWQGMELSDEYVWSESNIPTEGH